MRGKPRWTPEEDHTLWLAANEGATAAEAVAELPHRTIQGIVKRRRLLDLPRAGKLPNPYRWAGILSLLDEGLSLVAIAKRLGVTYQTVQITVRRMWMDGLVTRQGTHTRTVRYVPVRDRD